MKILWISLILAFVLPSCAPKINSKIIAPQPAASPNAYVLVIPKQTPFTNNGIEIGTVKAGDNGFSANCSYSEVMEQLKMLARQYGANILKVEKYKPADQWSSCDRVTAKLYKVPDFRKHETEIEWTPDRKLTWDDFKGVAGLLANPQTGAQTQCGFGFVTNRLTIFKKAKIYTRNVFDCKSSWVRPGLETNDRLLRHEQAHFDLSEVYTRRLRKELLNKKLTVFTLIDRATEIFEAQYEAYLKRQQLYDSETNHGLNEAAQTKWEREIAQELVRLDSYAATLVH